jgi:hypothetical protein
LSEPIPLLPHPYLLRDLRTALNEMAQLPLEVLLERQGLLRPLARELLLRRCREEVHFSQEESRLIRESLFQGFICEQPASLEGDWITTLPESLRAQITTRWDQLRLQKWMEDRYGDKVEAYFLERRADLEQVVFRMIRLQQQGIAEELYLRLIDAEESFGDLASRYSLGDERYTRGLVGPLPLSQPHPTVRAVLASLTAGDFHPPFVVDQTILLVRLEHRLPARLDAALRQQLLRELLQPDLDATVETVLRDLFARQQDLMKEGAADPEALEARADPLPNGSPNLHGSSSSLSRPVTAVGRPALRGGSEP